MHKLNERKRPDQDAQSGEQQSKRRICAGAAPRASPFEAKVGRFHRATVLSFGHSYSPPVDALDAG